MIRTILTTMIVTLALLLMAAFAIAQEPILVNYQGQLNDSDGDPVPDGSYQVSFGLWDDLTNGIQLWMEVHPAVQTSNGMFNVELGSIDPFDLATLQTQPLYLEIRVENDTPMSPRIHLTSVPRGVIAQRMNGDIQTGEGSLFLLDPGGDSAISMLTDGTDNTIKVNWPEPQGVVSSAIELANVGNTGSRIWMYHPTDDPPGPMIEINADPINGNSITLHSAEPLLCGSGIFRGTSTSGAILALNHNPAPHEQVSVIELSSAPEDFGHIKMFNGRIEPPPVYLEMNTAYSGDQTGSNFIMYNSDPANYGLPVVELSTNSAGDQSGASLVMFNPQPEPPGSDPDPFIEMQTFENSASFVMFNPQPEPPGQDPLMGMFTNPLGANFEMTAPGMGRAGAEITDPILELTADESNGNFRMYSPNLGADVGPVMDMNSGIDGSWSWVLFNPQPEPPGRPVMEMNTGPGGEYSWLMFNPQPEPPGRAIMEMSTSIAGPSFKMTSPEAEGGGLEITDPLLEITADNTGARIKLFDTAGGTTVEISNDGDIDAKRGNFGSGNTLTGSSAFVAGSFNTVGGQEAFAAGESNTVNGFRATILGGDNNISNGMRSTVCGGSYNSVHATSAVIPGGYNSTINSTALYSCLIGIDASLSEDSTFMVDLPHIRFGDETDGYEFPTVDGDAEQVLITNGNGELTWIDFARIDGGDREELINLVEELKRQNTELERRITKLESVNR